MAQDDADDSPAESAGKSSGLLRWVFISVGLFVLVTVSNVVASFIVPPAARVAAPDEAANPQDADGETDLGRLDPPLYYPVNPELVVNYGPDGTNFLQVNLEVMTRSQEVIDAVKDHNAVIRNNLLMLFSGQTHEALITREGREELRAQACTEIQRVLEPYVGTPNVEQVYFTSFVTQ